VFFWSDVGWSSRDAHSVVSSKVVIARVHSERARKRRDFLLISTDESP
jgi:hypothetical protein